MSRPKDEDGDFQLDSDEPSDSATVGYLLNHLFLNVGNLLAGIAFYAKGLGCETRSPPRLPTITLSPTLLIAMEKAFCTKAMLPGKITSVTRL